MPLLMQEVFILLLQDGHRRRCCVWWMYKTEALLVVMGESNEPEDCYKIHRDCSCSYFTWLTRDRKRF